MRIALVTHSIYEQDNRVIRYAETLVGRGDEVDVISLRRPGDSTQAAVAGVNVFRVQERVHNEKGRFSYLSRILAFFCRAMFMLNRRHRECRYDLVHVNSVPDFLVFTAFVQKIEGAKIILDIHDILPEFYASKFGVSESSTIFKALLRVERVSCAFADHVVIANHLWYDRITKRSLAREKCTVLLNYPDRRIFQARGRTRNDKKFVVAYPGTLNWHQGVDIAIRAFEKVRRAAPFAEFHVYGNGAAKQSLMELIDELKLSDAVFLHPARPMRDVPEVMENADLIVVPKRKNSFGNQAFSTKIFEAMILGVPVVVSDTDIDKYYFDDSLVTFFRGGDEEHLAQSILGLINDPERRRRQAENASAYVKEQEWESNKWRYLDIVNALTRRAARNNNKST